MHSRESLPALWKELAKEDEGEVFFLPPLFMSGEQAEKAP
jgi:hypothetical protein